MMLGACEKKNPRHDNGLEKPLIFAFNQVVLGSSPSGLTIEITGLLTISYIEKSAIPDDGSAPDQHEATRRPPKPNGSTPSHAAAQAEARKAPSGSAKLLLPKPMDQSTADSSDCRLRGRNLSRVGCRAV
jgi:hypothetical protein